MNADLGACIQDNFFSASNGSPCARDESVVFFIAGAAGASDGVVAPDGDGIVIIVLLFYSGIVIVSMMDMGEWWWSSQCFPISIASLICCVLINQNTRQFLHKGRMYPVNC